MRHIKRIISAVLFAAMLITSLSAVTVSADESIKVILDGKQLQFDVRRRQSSGVQWFL